MSESTIPKDEPQALTVVESTDLTMERTPKAVLVEAREAARELADVIGNKKKPVMMNGEQYLEFEDWQTVGRFYGVTAKVESTKLLELGVATGYESVAVAIHTASGREISRAESMCLNDERNWSSKPLFQLRSMAQTRACAKALRNVLAWVVVLAGYKPTPAEEMEHPATYGATGKASNAQLGMLHAKMGAKADETGALQDEITGALKAFFGVSSGSELEASDVDKAIKFIADWEPGQLKAEPIQFPEKDGF